MRICVVGTGYVGLTTGLMLAELDHQVCCVDIDENKVAMLNSGKIPIYEPGTEEVLQKHLGKNLTFTTQLAEGVQGAIVIIIAVGTPPGRFGIPDVSGVETVAEQITPYLDTYKVIVIKSTVPVGTGERVKQIIENTAKFSVQFDMISNPEFLREGCALHDCFNTDRIVIGGDSPKAIRIVWSMYSTLAAPCVVTSISAAEMIKYVSNAFLAMKISFTNEIAAICEVFNIDIMEVSKGVGFDHRIGRHFLGAGAGYGGSCLPKDLQGLIYMAKLAGAKSDILKSVKKVNDLQIERIITKLTKEIGSLSGKQVAIWGLTFKPDTDDLRAAPALSLVKALTKSGVVLRVYDPIGMEKVSSILPPEVILAEDMYSAVRDVDGLVIATEWPVFKTADLLRLQQTMRQFVIIDGRNIFDPVTLKNFGCRYHGMGR